MGLVKRKDLNFERQYNWNPLQGENYEKSFFPNDAILNRREGYEVLSVVNTVLKKLKTRRKSVGLEVERLIQEDMPKFIRNRMNAITWLKDQIQGAK